MRHQILQSFGTKKLWSFRSRQSLLHPSASFHIPCGSCPLSFDNKQADPSLLSRSTLALMEDDTRRLKLAPFSTKEKVEMHGLWKLHVDRAEADLWALRDMKFLVYDDDIDEASGAADAAAGSCSEKSSPPCLRDPHPEPGPRGSSGGGDGREEKGQGGVIQIARDLPMEDATSWSGDPPSPASPAGHEGHAGPSSGASAGHRKPSAEDLIRKCKVCARVPEFPNNRKTRKFRLFRPTAESESPETMGVLDYHDICRHYVAVSYCWPAPPPDGIGAAGGSTQVKTCQVRDLDGSTRAARALDDVLDRAVDFANTVGFRMIWIDQECLPQPTEVSPQEEKDYQRIGVRAMDIVYQRALATAGLHNGLVDSQEQLDAINTLINLDLTNGDSLSAIGDGILPAAVLHATRFLNTVVSDQCYKRAWVVQEALNAGAQLFLVFRRAPGIVGRSRFRGRRGRCAIGHRSLPPHSLDGQEPKVPSEVVGIGLLDFHKLLRTLRSLYDRNRSTRLKRVQGLRMAGMAEASIAVAAVSGHFYQHLEAAEAIHSTATLEEGMWTDCRITIPTMYGNDGRAVSAATAFAMLRTRECRDAQDRIAIMANMCRYEFRIDPDAVTNCGSLRAGILSLALLNSDFSLLVPEMYPCPREKFISDSCPDPECSCAVRFDGGLFSPFDTHPGAISDSNPQSFIRFRPTVYRYRQPPTKLPSSPGLPLAAHIWTVDKELKLEILRAKYSDIWNDLKDVNMEPDAVEGETREDWFRRAGHVERQFAPDDIDFKQRFKAELLRHNSALPKDSPLWGDLAPGSVKFQLYFNTDRVAADSQRQMNVGRIIFSILLHLATLKDAYGYELANGIWQSLRVGFLPSWEGTEPLPDIVCGELFTHPAVQAAPFQTLKLDKDSNSSRGGYYQTWFVDRIMQKGTLWAGRYTQPIVGEGTAAPQDLKAEFIRRLENLHSTLIKPVSSAEKGEGPGMPEATASKNKLDLRLLKYMSKGKPYNSDKLAPSAEKRGGPLEMPEEATTKTVIHKKQFIERVHRDMAIGFAYRFPEDERKGIRVNASNLVALMHSMDIVGGAITNERGRGGLCLAATFDVDGRCTVATPYNPAWEVLPRPAERSMSTCWVVVKEEPGVSGNKDGEGRRDGREAKGSGGLADDNAAAAAAAAEDGVNKQEAGQEDEGQLSAKARGKKVQRGSLGSLASEATTARPGNGAESSAGSPASLESCRYRVVRKVKGLRKLMDMPEQVHEFV
ncbi:hypothetical protein RB598_002328 [Gaeumannomyces tritici]